MKKFICLMLCVSAFVMWWATLPVDHTNKNMETTQKRSLPNEQDSIKKTLLGFLPAQTSWPKPVRIFWEASNIKKTAQSKIGENNWVPLNKIPQTMQNALIVVEDRRFYEHHGVDMDGIIRALLVNIQADDIVQGGSTLTQQLVKNTLLDPEQSMERKLLEAFFALWVESQNSKEDILEMYLNTTYFGAGATGIKEAAHTYFGEEPSQLSLSESATLAGLPNAPSALNPYDNPDGCKRRRNIVLGLMSKYGYAHAAEAKAAVNEPIILVGKDESL